MYRSVITVPVHLLMLPSLLNEPNHAVTRIEICIQI